MKYERKVENRGFKRAVFSVFAKKPKDIFGCRKLLFGEMDEQAFSAVIVLIGLIPIHSEHRENGNQLQTLSEHIRNRNIVRVFVIGV